MKQKNFKIISTTNSALETELAFYIATARAEKAEIIKISIEAGAERFLPMAEKILRSLKKAGKIQLFELAERLASDTASAWYLKNKYPQNIETWAEEKLSLIVKI